MKFQIALAIIILNLVACTPRAGIVADQQCLFLEDRDSPLVIVMRQSQFTGGSITKPLALDAKVIAHLGTGDYVEFQVHPGEHYIAMGKKLFFKEVIRFEAKAKNKYYFHYSVDQFSEEGPAIFIRLTPEDGERELSTNKYHLLSIGQ